ncbi:MAG: hypothetical protein IKU34_09760 [Clostridia bacterium]|nr:hypothetical protein [Clostridia bacterium]
MNECHKETIASYADAARAYFKYHRVFRYGLKKITDMTDSEVVQKCHFWQEENNMVQDYWSFVKENYPELG